MQLSIISYFLLIEHKCQKEAITQTNTNTNHQRKCSFRFTSPSLSVARRLCFTRRLYVCPLETYVKLLIGSSWNFSQRRNWRQGGTGQIVEVTRVRIRIRTGIAWWWSAFSKFSCSQFILFLTRQFKILLITAFTIRHSFTLPLYA